VPVHVKAICSKTLKKLYEDAGKQTEIKTNQITDLTRYDGINLNMTDKMLRSVIAAARSVWVASFEEPAYGANAYIGHRRSTVVDNAYTLADVVSSDKPNIEEEMSEAILVTCLKQAFNELSIRDQNLIKLRYGVDI
jgi:DNA-directed RNA polymerase sigma subunit (sigma70/sigma32)